MLSSPCTSPTRLSGVSVSLQSAAPVTAVGIALRIPNATRRCAARRLFLPPDDVEDEGAGPEPDRQVGQHRMDGVAQPRTAQGVLDPRVGDRALDPPARGSRDPVERLEPLDRTRDRVGLVPERQVGATVLHGWWVPPPWTAGNRRTGNPIM